MVQNQKKNKKANPAASCRRLLNKHIYIHINSQFACYIIFSYVHIICICACFSWIDSVSTVKSCNMFARMLAKCLQYVYPTLGGRNLATISKWLAFCGVKVFVRVWKNVDNIFPILGAYWFWYPSRTEFDVRSCHANWSLWGHHVTHGFPQSYL